MAALLSTHGFRDQMMGIKYTVLNGALCSEFKCRSAGTAKERGEAIAAGASAHTRHCGM